MPPVIRFAAPINHIYLSLLHPLSRFDYRYKNISRSKSRAFLISSPRANAPSSFVLASHPYGMTGSSRLKPAPPFFFEFIMF
jgi:hypothetical protein